MTTRHAAYCDAHLRFAAGCADCCRRNVRWTKRYRLDRQLGRPRLVLTVGTARRLRALAALGWPARELGARTGMSVRQIQHLQAERSPRVTTTTATAITALYDHLSMQPGPSAKSRTDAIARGWPPPLAWDDDTIDAPTATPTGTIRARRNPRRDVDEVAVRRAAAGERLNLSAAERAALVSLLARQGLPDAQIADRVGLTARSVERIRARHGIPAAAAA